MNDVARNGTFTWINNEPVIFTYFNSDTPNNAGGNENCVYTRTDSFKWDDVDCDLKKPSVCEIDFNVDTVEFNGFNYYFGVDKLSVDDASLQCNQRGGDLVSFANELEWRFAKYEGYTK